VLLGVQHSELLQRPSDTARSRERQLEEAKATGQSVHFCDFPVSSKNYAVGLEIECPGGACYWAPEIPSDGRLAGPVLSKSEPVHNLAHS
jgi:hypothetical protein